MLHLVAFPPSRTDLLEQLCQAYAQGDALVLLDDAVWFSQPGFRERLVERLPESAIHVLQADLEHAGLANPGADMRPVDYEGLVSLTETHQQSASWYPREAT